MSLNTAAGNAYYQGANTLSFTGQWTTGANTAALILTWHGLLQGGLGGPRLSNVTVRARITVRSDSPLSYWAFEADGLGTNFIVYILYPHITGIDELGSSGDDDVLLLPEENGLLVINPVANITGPRRPIPWGLPIHGICSYLDPTSGFYFASDDTQGSSKAFCWTKENGPAGSHLAM